MNNLSKFIAIEKVLQSVGHGKVNLELTLRSGNIVGITTRGNKKTLYNASEKDENTNQIALAYIVKRVSQQFESSTQWELGFKVGGIADKIKVIEVESQQTQK